VTDRFKKLRIGVALGGGGARGMAHIGVLKAFDREQIPVDLIVGTSAGALIGAMYAQLGSAEAVERRFRQFLKSPVYQESALHRFRKKVEAENFFAQVANRIREQIVINLAYSRRGIFQRKRMREVIDFLIDDQEIEDLPIPFAAVAVDLITGQEVYLASGNLREAVEASSALPGYFQPFEKNGQLLVDGAVLQVVPTLAAKRLGATFVIAVNVSQDLRSDPPLNNIVDVIFRSTSITSHRYKQYLLQEADIVLRPPVGDFHWSDFHCYDQCVRLGEQTAEKALPVLKRELAARKGIRRFWYRKKSQPIHIEL